MTLAAAIRSMPHINLTITRPGATVWGPNGQRTPGSEQQFVIQANVWPARAKELLLLPEGQRTTGTLAFITATKVAMNDYFEHDGNTYEVQVVEDWSIGGGFYQALAVKQL